MTHGIRTTYVKGCRCEECRQANRIYAKQRERHLARVAWQVEDPDLIDSTPIRAHLKQLRASGMGRRVIARRSGVSLTVVSRLIGIDHSKPAERVRQDTAKKLLALTPGNVADGSLIDSKGSRRRLQALVAIGWPQSTLANCLGMTPSNFATMLTRNQVKASTASDINALFQSLHMMPGSSSRARVYASDRGWLPPLAWDDIDNDKKPQKGVAIESDYIDWAKIELARDGKLVKLTRAERHAAVNHWISEGTSLNEVDRILGLKLGSTSRLMQRNSNDLITMSN